MHAININVWSIVFNAVCPNATGGTSTIHTSLTAFITALVLTGVAVIFYWRKLKSQTAHAALEENGWNLQ